MKISNEPEIVGRVRDIRMLAEMGIAHPAYTVWLCDVIGQLIDKNRDCGNFAPNGDRQYQCKGCGFTVKASLSKATYTEVK